ncbi:MAG: glycosyltransferase, partial [Syntrophomonas sp.]
MIQQLLKFGATGVLNTLIDFGVFNLLVAITGITSGWEVGLLNGIALALAATNSYVFNRNWTFNTNREYQNEQVQRFIIATLIGMFINSSIVTAVSAFITWVPVSALIILNGGKLLGAAASSTWNFLTYRNLVFKASPQVLIFNDSYTPGLVSLIIPAYNEMERLPRRLLNLAAALPEYFPVEILVVDDGSSDNTGDIIHKLSDRFPFIRCLGYPDNRGKGEAVRTGMSAAAGEFLIYTDADDTFTEEHIAMVAEKLRQGAEVVAACRQEIDGKRLAGESILRQILGKGFNCVVQFMFLPGLNDTQCGLKGFNRQAAQAVFPRQRLKRFAFDVELLSLARVFDFNIIQVPVQAIDCEGSRVHCLRTPIQMAGELLKLKMAFLTNRYRLPGAERHLQNAALAAGLFLVALAVRIPWLWEVPRYIDELKEVNLAYLIYQGEAWPLHNAAHDIGALHNYILAGVFKILGPGIYWPRLYVAITAALTVVLIYYLGKHFYGKWVGIIAAGLLLTNGMHILVTHMAWSNCTTPFFFILAMMATLRAEENKSGKWLLTAAFLWAMALQTHSSVIIYILVVAIYILRPGFRNITGINFKWYLGAACAFLLGYSNMIYYNLVSIGGSIRWLSNKGYAMENSPSLFSYLHNWQQMYIELIRAMGSIYIDYGNSWQYLINPVFLIVSVLLLAGSYLAIKKGQALPVWILIGGFALIPWINQRYVFYLATRYIMPLIICGILLIAYALSEIAQIAYDRWQVRRLAFMPLATGTLLLIITLQLVPLYSYCGRLENTNESNQA